MFVPSKSRCLSVLIGALTVGLMGTAAAALPSSGGGDAAPVVTATGLTASAGFGKVPLHFEPNVGQTRQTANFLARGPGYELLLTPDDLVLGLQHPPANANPGSPRSASFIRAHLAGASKDARASSEGALTGYSNYLQGRDPSQWHTQVPQFERVRYQGVYPNVDLVYYGNQQQLEYDFVVAPGGDPNVIRLHYSGVDNARLAADGSLHLQVADAELVEHKPRIYQTRDGAMVPVDGRFTLDNTHGQGLEVAFAVGDYDRSLPLVIDPILTYSTFLGGSISDAPGGLAVDANGRSYIAGSTISLDFPTTPGSVQPVSGGQSDAFVVKLSADGKSLMYATYLGGSLDDFANSIAVDSTGAAYVLGSTASTDFPVTANAFQKSLNGTGNSDVFVAKLSADGSSLVYATYLGGTGNDTAAGIALDGSGAAYVLGQTYSRDFPTTANAIAHTLAGNWDSFVTKLSADGSSLVYSTYIGGANDVPAGIAVDTKGSAYLTGSATTTFPVTSGAFQTVNAGPRDAFVSKLSADGSQFVYSTFIGGSVNDAASGIAVDAKGSAYISGTTASKDFPVTAGAYQKSYIAQFSSAFVSKLTADGSHLAYSTYLSGIQQDSALGIAVDAQGHAFVTGSTQSSNFPVTTGAPQASYAGNGDAFVTELSANGSSLIFSTFLGGTAVDQGNDIAVDATGNVYVIGQSTSTDFPTTAGAFETAFNGSAQEVFAFRLAPFTANPGLLDFGSVAAGSPSPLQTVTLTNSSSSPISLSSISTGTSQFVRTGSTCTGQLAAAASCSVTLRFVPSAVGAFADQLTFATSDGAAVVLLKGFGTGAAIALSPAALNFGDQLVGTTSGDKQVSITNTGTNALIISSLSTSAGFSQSGTCFNISPGATCPINVQFTPTAVGPLSGTLTVVSNAYQAAPPVSLFGNGIAPAVSLSATSLAFGNQNLGTSSAAQVIHLTNSGTGALAISSISVGSPYTQTTTCGTRLDVGAQCDINVTFAPTAAGNFSGTLQIVTNAATSPDRVSLSGAGVGPKLTLSASQLAFGNQVLNTTSAPKTLTLTNSGSSTLTIQSITVSAGFVQTNNCSTVAAGASCTANVSFAPTVAGPTRLAVLTITSDSYTSPDTVRLSGTGVTAPAVSLSPTSLSYGNVNLGTTTAANTVQLKNSGSATLSLTSIVASAQYAQTNNCGSSLAPAAACTINVTFRPVSIGAVNGTLTLTTNASTSPNVVTLTGAGIGPQATLSPTSLNFGSQAATTTSRSQTVTVTNTGTVSLTLGSPTVSGNFVLMSNNCGASLAPGGSCALAISFAPPVTGAFTGTLTLPTNAFDNPSKVSLSGTGI